ncbi:class I SAM-dependent methyltransferase [Nocardia stercoris]|uniref:S-adenosyl-L-methionine-dependent methyltransferase n=1 Tax=Nocardia stercoris TaxID=2483361 RepID=A0A3M2L390_9NOCA|nr:class I SAM-dependent methyltransferase [Nocardia stercoris]RMI30983.1 SAM-dependent methyltransferase [Nocardia stercoris]
MLESKPSITCVTTAVTRACHQVAPDPPVFADPLAVPILGMDPVELREKTAGTDNLGRRTWRLFLAARARFAEETIAAGVAAGARQVVLLGAGLETFAYRNPHAGVRVVEVDHPNTQVMKVHLLRQAGIAVPETVAFAPVDFETQSLADGLAAAGWRRDEPAVFVWQGVLMYLERPAIAQTLEYVAGQGGPVHLVTDYLQPVKPTDPEFFHAQDSDLAAAGEPIHTRVTPDEVAELLRSYGFADIDDRSTDTLLRDYGAWTADDTAWDMSHVVRAVHRGSAA